MWNIDTFHGFCVSADVVCAIDAVRQNPTPPGPLTFSSRSIDDGERESSNNWNKKGFMYDFRRAVSIFFRRSMDR